MDFPKIISCYIGTLHSYYCYIYLAAKENTNVRISPCPALNLFEIFQLFCIFFAWRYRRGIFLFVKLMTTLFLWHVRALHTHCKWTYLVQQNGLGFSRALTTLLLWLTARQRTHRYSAAGSRRRIFLTSGSPFSNVTISLSRFQNFHCTRSLLNNFPHPETSSQLVCKAMTLQLHRNYKFLTWNEKVSERTQALFFQAWLQITEAL